MFHESVMCNVLIKLEISEHIYLFIGDLREQDAGMAICNILIGFGVLYTV